MPRVVQLTDTHIYASPADRFDGLDTRASLAAVLAELRTGPPIDLLVLSGDLSMDGSRASYAWLDVALADFPAPLAALPGNHDEPANWPRGAAGGFTVTPKALACGRWRLLLLDSRIAGVAHGALGRAQLAWLERTLAARPAGMHDIVFLHHPPLAVDSPWIDAMGLRDAAAFWQALPAGAQPVACVAGHVHQTFDRLHAGVRVMTTPSTCVQFAPRARHYATDARAPGYRVFELGDDGRFATEVVRVPLP
ncbi:MAG: metallophosphoesterase [Gammaproteobacteria bacterium]